MQSVMQWNDLQRYEQNSQLCKVPSLFTLHLFACIQYLEDFANRDDDKFNYRYRHYRGTSLFFRVSGRVVQEGNRTEASLTLFD